MSEQSPPQVEIAPTVIVSNSSEGEEIIHAEESTGSASNEAIADGAPSEVAIAAIEAERDIALAEIHSDVERARIDVEEQRVEAIVERNEELEECRKEIAELRERVEQMALLIPPPPLVEVVEEQSEIAAEPNLTPPSTAAPTLETMMEPSEESAAESPVEEIPVVARVRKYIAI